MIEWSASSYERFEAERTRPVRDLLASVPDTIAVREATDLGCGSGTSTAALLERFPGAAIEGIDSAPDMIRAARARLPGRRFTLGTIEAWSRGNGSRELVVANASLHWLPDHEALLPRLLGRLRPGGHLAIQMPDNLDEPSHVCMRRIAADGPWAERLREAAGARSPVRDARWYHRVLRPACRQLDVWQTVYVHVLPEPDAIVQWFGATGLLPFLGPLEGDERVQFLERYRAAIRGAYRPLEDGSVLLPMPRMFLVATR